MSTRDELATELATVNGNIAQMLADPRPNYKVCDVWMFYGNLLDSLYKIRWELEAKIRAIPTDSWDSFDTTVDSFGRDQAEYQGD